MCGAFALPRRDRRCTWFTARDAWRALQIGLMLVAMLNCTLMLVIILKHDCSQPTGSTMTPTQVFLDFWQTRCVAL